MVRRWLTLGLLGLLSTGLCSCHLLYAAYNNLQNTEEEEPSNADVQEKIDQTIDCLNNKMAQCKTKSEEQLAEDRAILKNLRNELDGARTTGDDEALRFLEQAVRDQENVVTCWEKVITLTPHFRTAEEVQVWVNRNSSSEIDRWIEAAKRYNVSATQNYKQFRARTQTIR